MPFIFPGTSGMYRSVAGENVRSEWHQDEASTRHCSVGTLGTNVRTGSDKNQIWHRSPGRVTCDGCDDGALWIAEVGRGFLFVYVS